MQVQVNVKHIGKLFTKKGAPHEALSLMRYSRAWKIYGSMLSIVFMSASETAARPLITYHSYSHLPSGTRLVALSRLAALQKQRLL